MLFSLNYIARNVLCLQWLELSCLPVVLHCGLTFVALPWIGNSGNFLQPRFEEFGRLSVDVNIAKVDVSGGEASIHRL